MRGPAPARCLRALLTTSSERNANRPRCLSALLIQYSSPANHCSSNPLSAINASRRMKIKHPAASSCAYQSTLNAAKNASEIGPPRPSNATREPPPTAPRSSSRSACRSTVSGSHVSASTKIRYGAVVACPPALRTAAICRFSTRTTRAPAAVANAAVRSLLASSTTSNS